MVLLSDFIIFETKQYQKKQTKKLCTPVVRSKPEFGLCLRDVRSTAEHPFRNIDLNTTHFLWSEFNL